MTTEDLIGATNLMFDDWEVIKNLMIEYAKFHRKAILEEVADDYTYYLQGDEGSETIDKEKFFKEVYTLNNIK